MALLNILQYPDERLHTVAKPVEQVDERIQKLVADMFETMYEARGIGLAATQVDVHERVVVMDLTEDRSEPRVFINPVIVEKRRRNHLRRRLPVRAGHLRHRYPRRARQGRGFERKRREIHAGGGRSVGDLRAARVGSFDGHRFCRTPVAAQTGSD